MTTRNVVLTSDEDDFPKDLVASARYQNASERMRPGYASSNGRRCSSGRRANDWRLALRRPAPASGPRGIVPRLSAAARRGILVSPRLPVRSATISALPFAEGRKGMHELGVHLLGGHHDPLLCRPAIR